MATPQTDQTRTYGEQQLRQAESEARKRREVRIRKALEVGNEALVEGNYYRLGCVTRDRLLPSLDIGEFEALEYHSVLSESLLAWDLVALKRFLTEADSLVRQLASGGRIHDQRLKVRGQQTATAAAQKTVAHAFKSLESAAVAQAIIPGDLTQSSQVLGHTLQLGRKWQSFNYETPDEIRVVNPELHPPFHMSVGKPGNGKSTSVDTLVEDCYAAGHKIIDLLDFDELENGMYDVPSQDAELNAKREELGLPPTWDEHDDYERPEFEILHPLCRGLCNASIPYDTESEAFRVRPFVIPAADLDHATLKAMFPFLTDSQENHLDAALESLSDTDDWTLDDLNEAIMMGEADAGVKRRLATALETLESRGFIASRSHEYAIDWEAMFRDTETITSITCSLMDQEAHKLMVTAYLLDAIYDERQTDMADPGRADQYPRAIAVFREMQAAAPGDSKLKGDGSTIALKKELIDRMQKLSEKRRHTNLGMYADTQQWLQTNSRVRANADRLMLFKLNAGQAKSLFNKITGERSEGYSKSVSEFPRGVCSVLGSEWLSTGNPFAQPISWAPPMCHHYDSEEEINGWHARVTHLDDEELRESPYTMDDRQIDASETDEESGPAYPEGFEPFIEECVVETGDRDDRTAIEVLRRAYDGYVADHDHAPAATTTPNFGKWVRDAVDVERGKELASNLPDHADSRRKAYIGLALTDAGKEYADV